MIRSLAVLCLLASAAPVGAQSRFASLETGPAALNLFERDWVLMNWALKYYDSNHDVLIEPSEAQAAAEGFRKLADRNGDGRVTPDEYRAAREEILAKD